ncbi:MAG: DNA topoisomerase I [Thermoplasmata archaeon]|nr:DNA topoisomerase I [Thermoplasmata archaeon]
MAVLVIAEKYNAAMRIATILAGGKAERKMYGSLPVFQFKKDGEEWHVVGLRGHIIELDFPEKMNSWEKTDLSKLVVEKPLKEVRIKGIASVVKNLASKAGKIIIATDYDREGELIGKEILEIAGISPRDAKVKRAKFSALTKQEITEAFQHLQDFDEALADAAAARQEIDLKWGAVLTRFISTSSGRVGKNFLSVGRVQSPTLALVVENDNLIKNFVPQRFWEIFADLKKKETVTARHIAGRIFDEQKVKEILAKLEGAETATVKEYTEKDQKDYPPPPFNTTTFLAEASKIGYSPAKAMQIAEDLYMRGLISYPRTDNTVYPPTINLRSVLQELRNSPFREMAEEVLSQERIHPSRGKMETTDHPPIYPVSAAQRDKLKKEEWDIYELVVRRFLATLAPPAVFQVKKVVFEIKEELFVADGSVMIEEGWRRYYTYSKRAEIHLPVFRQGEVVAVDSIHSKEDKTKPPARYSQSALLQAMEKLGLGTKSTRHEIIQKLYERKYITGNPVVPTPSGHAVIDALKTYAEIVTKPEMTSKLEEEMSEIAAKKRKMESVIKDSEEILLKIVELLEKNRKGIGDKIRTAIKEQHHLGRCGKCGGDLSIIHANGKRRFVGCSNYPACGVSFPIPQTGHIEKTEEKCEQCEMPVIKITHKGHGSEKICINPECTAHTEKRKIGVCPRCGSEMQVMHGKTGKRFVGCTNYPRCKTAYPLPQTGKIVYTGKHCKDCGAPVVKVVVKKNAWELCVNPECKGKK